MMSRLFSATFFGIDTLKVEIEVDIQMRVKSFEIVGLPGLAVRESVKRIESAIENSGYHFPGKRIIVNLAPAGIRKMGTLFDLPIAIGVLSDQFQFPDLNSTMLVGELSLDGRLRAIPGGLPITIKAKELGFRRILCPSENAKEMSVISGLEIIPLNSLMEAVEYLCGEREIPPYYEGFQIENAGPTSQLDMSDIKGLESVKRAVEIAASGNHNMILIGPPGTGKTMIAQRIPTILPDLNIDESIETTKIYSVAGMTSSDSPLVKTRPFRAPHHTASDVAIIGGGRFPRPGEVSLAHNGVLFLDEFQQFKSNVLQVLRQPLEDRKVSISRAEGSVEFPARFMLIAALNPSRTNNDLDRWEVGEMKAMLSRLSGPLLDRIDLQVQVSRIRFDQLSSKNRLESSVEIRNRVTRTRDIQLDRLKIFGIYTNAEMSHKLIERFCKLQPTAEKLMKVAMEKFLFSIRTYDKILKIARTIADLEQTESVMESHISEALQYRVLDRIVNFLN